MTRTIRCDIMVLKMIEEEGKEMEIEILGERYRQIGEYGDKPIFTKDPEPGRGVLEAVLTAEGRYLAYRAWEFTITKGKDIRATVFPVMGCRIFYGILPDRAVEFLLFGPVKEGHAKKALQVTDRFVTTTFRPSFFLVDGKVVEIGEEIDLEPSASFAEALRWGKVLG